MDANISRRELILRGAFAGAMLALPGAEALAGVRQRRPRQSVHCLPAPYRFTPKSVYANCTFAAYAPDGRQIALATANGIELLNRADGSRRAITRPGFTLAADAWHPDGTVLLASGPAEDGSGPFLHAVDPVAGTTTRLLPDHPGEARAACFSPDGKKVAFTYVNGFVHKLCMADWSLGVLNAPLDLIPFHPGTEPLLSKLISGLCWYETRGFSADGQRLYFASDRGAGMLNINLHFIELATAKRRKVTHDHGVLEGGAISRDDSTLYFSGTRARESGFLTLVSGPSVPPLLGFVAEPTLHALMDRRSLAPIGNGDILAVDETYGMGARMIGRREAVVAKLGAQVEDWLYRTVVCSMSPDGQELAVALSTGGVSHIVALRRKPTSVPPPVAPLATPSPKGAVPLRAAPFGDVKRTVKSEYRGSADLEFSGTISNGRFRADFKSFNSDGVKVFSGHAEFQTVPDGFRHSADVRRVNFDETEEADTFYRASVDVNYEGVTGGTLDSRSRHGSTSAAWDGTRFANLAPWRSGRRNPEPIPGSRACKNTGRT